MVNEETAGDNGGNSMDNGENSMDNGRKIEWIMGTT